MSSVFNLYEHNDIPVNKSAHVGISDYFASFIVTFMWQFIKFNLLFSSYTFNNMWHFYIIILQYHEFLMLSYYIVYTEKTNSAAVEVEVN